MSNVRVLRLFGCLALVSLLVVTYLAAVSADATTKDGETSVPKIFNFGEFVEKYRKSYGPVETLRKAQLFLGRTLKIFQHNSLFADNKVGYFLRQNEFTDITVDELRQQHAGGQEDLAPVDEALTNPDMPADQSISVQKMRAELGDEGYSKSSVEDLSANPKYDSKTQSVKPFVNFMDDQSVADLKVVYDQLKEMPTNLSGNIANLIDMAHTESDKFRKSERIARRRNQVEIKPVIKSNNANYKPQMAPSFGLSAEQEARTTNYARYLMDDLSFGLNLEPYPVPKEFHEQHKKKHKTKKEEPKSILASFMDSVAAVGDLFYPSDDEDDDDDEDAGEQQGDKKPVANEEADRLLQTVERQLTGSDDSVARYNIDWRKTGCISPIQHQKSCQSCYAFTVLSLIEYWYCRQTKELTTFSAQYIVDCGHMAQLNGCRGGKISNVGQFIRSYGVELNAMYPYVGTENQCPYDDAEAHEAKMEKSSGYVRPSITRWQMFRDMAAWFKWLRKSPLIVGINMPSDFLAYAGGIHDGLDCVPDMTHAMLLVGSGIQNGKEFWLLKNSYSESWGESGYFRLSKSAPLRCFDSAIVARVKFQGETSV